MSAADELPARHGPVLSRAAGQLPALRDDDWWRPVVVPPFPVAASGDCPAGEADGGAQDGDGRPQP